MLFDNHNRPLTYLRLAVTDRCNLRCAYCMPEHGLEWLSRSALLSYEEMLRLCRILVEMGITKIRITGGEPFVRKDLIKFLEKLSLLPGLQEIAITTNGVATLPFLPALQDLGIRSVNLSLDTLDREQYFEITRRDELPAVLQTLEMLLSLDFHVKINAVAMSGKNEAELTNLARLAHNWPVEVRFIEEMPFNGGDHEALQPALNHARIFELLQAEWPDIAQEPNDLHATASNYIVPEFRGKIGIIAAWTRNFCGSCNRIRVTPQGMLKTCLYGKGELDIRALLRAGAGEELLKSELVNAFQRRYRDGWEAERQNQGAPESMAMIGG